MHHDERRLLFPKIIVLVLARLTNWKIHYELALNVLLALGIGAALSRQAVKTAKQLQRPVLVWALPTISLSVFSIY